MFGMSEGQELSIEWYELIKERSDDWVPRRRGLKDYCG